MLDDFPPTSPERQLVDTLYNYRMLGDLSSHDAVPVSAGNTVLDDAFVYEDQISGSRIIVSKLPADQARFNGAVVSIHNDHDPISFNTGEAVIDSTDLVFGISPEVSVSVQDTISGRVERVLPYFLATYLDLPQTRPFPCTGSDRRIPPAITPVQGIGPILDDAPPEEIYGYIKSRVEADRLIVPEERLYTALSLRFSGIDTHYDSQGRRLHKKMTKSGQATDYMFPHQYELKIEEISDFGVDDEDVFHREYALLYTSVDREIPMAATTFGHNEAVISDDFQFYFKLGRQGIIQKLPQAGKLILARPLPSTVNQILFALENGI